LRHAQHVAFDTKKDLAPVALCSCAAAGAPRISQIIGADANEATPVSMSDKEVFI